MNETTDATAILAPIWRRKWLILAVGIVVGALTYVYYKHQPTLYQSTTQIYLGAGSEQQVAERGAGSRKGPSASTQAALIQAIVLEAARKRLRQDETPIAKQAVKGKVRAKAAEKSEFVTITAEARKARSAALLANTVASTYVARQRANHQNSVRQSIAIARRQLRKIEALRFQTHGSGKRATTGQSTSSVLQGASLSTKINQLEAQLAVRTVEQVKPAKPGAAILLQPKPRKSAIFGFIIGLVLAAIAAFTLGRFNRRLRSLADVESVLETRVLTVLPNVRRPIVHENGRPRPSKGLLEPLRRLHTAFLLGSMLEGESAPAPRSIMFISADPGDGKSTLTANLSLVQQDAGDRVLVIEANFRRPVLSKLLGLQGQHGLSDVLSGVLPADAAMQRVPRPPADAPVDGPAVGAGVATATQLRSRGEVSVLVGDNLVPNPPVLLASETMARLLAGGTEEFDRLLVDAPPLLEVSDVIPLLSAVDAIVIVARIGHTRESSAQRLQQLLRQTPSAPVLGVVANGARPADVRRFGIGAAGSQTSWAAKLLGR